MNSPERELHFFTSTIDGSERREWFILLLRWIWTPLREDAFRKRLAQFLQILHADETLQRSFSFSFTQMMEEMDSLSLFAEVGLPLHKGLVPEGVRRLMVQLLPAAQQDTDTARLLSSIFSSPRDVVRFLNLPEETFAVLYRSCWPEEKQTETPRLAADMKQALQLLATRVGGRGVSAAIRQRGTQHDVHESPFYQLIFQTDLLLESLRDSVPKEIRSERIQQWKLLSRNCRSELEQVHLHMDTEGVNSDLVFDLHSIELSLNRMELLLNLLAKPSGREHAEAVQNLLKQLIQARMEDTKLSVLLARNLNLIARKTVERTGKGGEHYIALSRGEYWKMWLAAVGGGLLTVFTAALKMRILENHFPPFVEGFLSGTNYAISFLLLQTFGLALATKLPSMTAATFAGLVRENRGYARWHKVSNFVALITRTQLAAALGNILAVALGAFAFERLWEVLFSKTYLPEASARHVYETLHPFTSGTALYAIVTGVILWLAALIGGWVENFAVYHRVPAAITQHPVERLLGKPRLQRISDLVEHNLAGWATNITLGYMLGFLPVISGFFGISLDVRHVTLNTGTLALAIARFGSGALGDHWMYAAIAGIGVTFVLNLGTSFSIAAYVALRAYAVPRREQLELLRFLVWQIFRHPIQFLVPVESAKKDIDEVL